jgi:O-succinylbenzoic acid--CoA ligase
MQPEINIKFITDNQELKTKVLGFIDEWNSNKNYITSQTSGSTGKPKTIKLLKKHLKASAQMTGEYFKFDEGQNILLSLSPDTIGGKMIIIRALEFNMHLIVSDVVKNPLLKLKEHISFVSLVPYQLISILEESPNKLNLIDNILLGGAPVSKSLSDSIKHFPMNFYESYGMTETMSHVALKNLKDPIPNFTALGNTWFSTSNESLIIHAPHLGINSLETNDQVSLVNSKQFNWLGRKDFVIISGGKKFHPEMLEKKIENELNDRFFITKEYDEKLGEKIVLLIENSYELELDNKIVEILVNKLEKHEIPKNIYYCLHFEETNSGKINRIATYQKWKNEH